MQRQREGADTLPLNTLPRRAPWCSFFAPSWELEGSAAAAAEALAQAVERLGGRVVERSRAADGAAQGEAWYLWCVWQEGRGSADDLEIQISEADQVIAVRSKARVARFPGFLAAKRQTDRLARLRAAAGLVEVSDPRAAAEGGARD